MRKWPDVKEHKYICNILRERDNLTNAKERVSSAEKVVRAAQIEHLNKWDEFKKAKLQG